MESQLLVVLDLSLGCVEDNEIRLEVLELLLSRTDEHIGDEVSLPGDFHDEADAQTGCGVCSAEAVNDIEDLVGELLDSLLAQVVPYFGGDGLVVVLIFFSSPPYGVLGHFILYQVFIFRGTSGVDTGHYVDSAEIGLDTLFVAGQLGVCFVLVELFVARIVDDLLDILNAILG